MVAQPFREEIRVPGAPAPGGVGAYAVQGFTAQDEHGHAAGGSDAAAQARFALVKDDLLVEIEVIAVRPPAGWLQP